MDVLSPFLGDACYQGNAEITTSTAELYRAYREWAREHGERDLSQREFSVLMREHGFDNVKNVKTGNGYRRGFRGVGLLETRQ